MLSTNIKLLGRTKDDLKLALQSALDALDNDCTLAVSHSEDNYSFESLTRGEECKYLVSEKDSVKTFLSETEIFRLVGFFNKSNKYDSQIKEHVDIINSHCENKLTENITLREVKLNKQGNNTVRESLYQIGLIKGFSFDKT